MLFRTTVDTLTIPHKNSSNRKVFLHEKSHYPMTRRTRWITKIIFRPLSPLQIGMYLCYGHNTTEWYFTDRGTRNERSVCSLRTVSCEIESAAIYFAICFECTMLISSVIYYASACSTNNRNSFSMVVSSVQRRRYINHYIFCDIDRSTSHFCFFA